MIKILLKLKILEYAIEQIFTAVKSNFNTSKYNFVVGDCYEVICTDAITYYDVIIKYSVNPDKKIIIYFRRASHNKTHDSFYSSSSMIHVCDINYIKLFNEPEFRVLCQTKTK